MNSLLKYDKRLVIYRTTISKYLSAAILSRQVGHLCGWMLVGVGVGVGVWDRGVGGRAVHGFFRGGHKPEITAGTQDPLPPPPPPKKKKKKKKRGGGGTLLH